jgi:release factor glutamine methyltransferase
MIIHEAQQQLQLRLTGIYGNREAANIADWVIEHLTGWSKIDRIIHKPTGMTSQQTALLQKYTEELLAHKPVQYVLHEVWFCGIKLYVDEHVLIPRPETEELVEWVMKEVSLTPSDFRIIDIGTGSGCIPIVLKKDLPGIEMLACDISEKALAVARKNAAGQQVAVQFHHLDFLNREHWTNVPSVNIIVSNPPYIPVKDKETMAPNVLQYEPHEALFVENDNPLLFYEAIADFAQKKLLPGGAIFAEIHEDLAEATKQLFISKGFKHVALKKDMQGKDRIVEVRH